MKNKDNKEAQEPINVQVFQENQGGSGGGGDVEDLQVMVKVKEEPHQHPSEDLSLQDDVTDADNTSNAIQDITAKKSLSTSDKGDLSSGKKVDVGISMKVDERIKSKGILKNLEVTQESIPPVDGQPQPSPSVPPTTLSRSVAQSVPHPVGAYAVSGVIAAVGGENAVSDDAGTRERTVHFQNLDPISNHDTTTDTNNNLVVANPVHENEDGHPEDLPTAESMDASEAGRKQAARSKEYKTYALLAVLVILGIVAILVAFLSPSKQESDATVNPETTAPTAPTSSPTQMPTTLEQSYLSLLPDNTVMVIEENPDSPQAKAFQWMMQDVSGFMELTDARIRQRFAMATLFYATNGELWVANQNWLNHSMNECEWEINPDFGEKGILSLAFKGFLSEMFPSTEPAPTTCNENGLIQNIWLDQNNLQGTLPLEVYMLTTLKTISLGGNSLPGTISSYIGQLTMLEGWASRNAEFTGRIPSEIGLLSNLRALVLFNNAFVGPLPTQIWTLTNLSTIAWAQNPNLKGTIPPDIHTMSNLHWLGLYGCGFTGSIPSTIGLLKQLDWIELLFNQLSGTIPTEIGQLTKVTLLTAYYNAFTGSLPTEIGLLTAMKLVRFGENQLTGTVPSELGLLTNLEVRLSLDHNHLSGTIPTQLGLLTRLTGLDFHENKLSGPIPSELGLIPVLGTLTLANNSLSGSVPQELSALHSSLYALSLEGNSLLSGTIPQDLCSLHGTCVPDALRTCESSGLSFDCDSLVCGCDCSCVNGTTK